jgi:hypothetical protein
VGIISPTVKTPGHEEASGPPGPIGTWETRKSLLSPVCPTQAITPTKRAAQAKLVKMVLENSSPRTGLASRFFLFNLSERSGERAQFS